MLAILGTDIHLQPYQETSKNKVVVKPTNTTRLLGHPQPQMYPPVALNQYTWVNGTHKHQGPMQILK